MCVYTFSDDVRPVFDILPKRHLILKYCLGLSITFRKRSLEHYSWYWRHYLGVVEPMRLTFIFLTIVGAYLDLNKEVWKIVCHRPDVAILHLMHTFPYIRCPSTFKIDIKRTWHCIRAQKVHCTCMHILQWASISWALASPGRIIFSDEIPCSFFHLWVKVKLVVKLAYVKTSFCFPLGLSLCLIYSVNLFCIMFILVCVECYWVGHNMIQLKYFCCICFYVFDCLIIKYCTTNDMFISHSVQSIAYDEKPVALHVSSWQGSICQSIGYIFIRCN